jgi:tetratricopeptide (TPR) repeat protein/predicted Ser/Thr protein kinase
MSAEPVGPTPSPAEAGLAKGATIGRYVVLGLLGRGGMGEVYAAYDPELDRKIAVKLLRSRGVASTVDARTRLLREAQAIARLSHPNVVVVFDVGTFKDSVFIAMEFVEGHTLGYWLQAKTRPWKEVLEVFQAAGRGLVAAHTAGLVHRDFKPENVMITKTGQVRVMDFGLARETGDDQPSPSQKETLDAAARAAALAETVPPEADPDDTMKLGGSDKDAPVPVGSGGYLRLKLTQTGAMLGTPAYMAPEQFAGTGGDARTDQFAFSIALYEGLYGHRPFAGDNVVAVMANVVAGTINEPPADSRVPSWLRKILMRGLSTRPADRFPSMAEMLAALAQDPAARRRRLATAAAGLAVLAGIAVGTHRLSAGQHALCAGGPARAATVWGPGQRKAIETAFAATGHKRAGPAFATAAALIDQYVGRWNAMYKETCEATQVRGEQSPEVLDLRMECLGERLSSVKALTEVFATADSGIVDNAPTATGSLPTLERCADVSMLRAVIKPPDDPVKRAEVSKLREDVAKVNVLASAGQCELATKTGRPIKEAASRLGYRPLEAEVAYALGRMIDTCFDTQQALTDLEDAVMAAEASRHDEVAIEASAWLAGGYADRAHDVRMGRHWIRHGEAILARFPGHPALEARIATSRGVVLSAEGRYGEAVNEERRALTIQEMLLGPKSLDVALSANNAAVYLHELGRDDEAETIMRRSMEIFVDVFGEDSGRVAITALNEGEILLALRRFDAVRALLAKVRTTLKEPGAFALGYLQLDEGKLELAEGNARLAVASLEASLSRLGNQEHRWTADAQFALARALWQLPSTANRKRAVDLVRGAAAAITEDPGAARLGREIAAWQREHAQPGSGPQSGSQK